MGVYLDCTFLLLTVAELSVAFNVYVPSAIIHEGPQGSYFGFAVDQHIEADSNWLLVGAPKANTSQAGVVEGGHVYKCQEASSDNKRPGLSKCEPVILDDKGNEGLVFGNNFHYVDGKYPPSEEKSHQWLGASVSSQEGIIVACAPRYVYFTNNVRRREPVGTCWYKTSSSSLATEISPCREGSPQMIPRWGYHKTGFCQAGFSTSLSSNGKQIVMGAVGSHYWQGQVFVKNISDSTGYGLLRTKERPYQHDDTYLGYSLTAADFTGDGQDEYAVSLPKSGDLKGEVSIFDGELRPLYNVSGEQLGEYFGYSVAAADLNGDGYKDLVVGAPFYAESKAVYEAGRVFVFYRDTRTRTIHQSHKSIIEGSKKSAARFGTSVASLGDINGDTYEDIVVGAPYDGELKAGAIYIFHGSTLGVKQEPSQVIFAKAVDSRLRGFGFSVAGGNDLDKNSYNDILVGAYSSDAAVYFKSRPIIKVSVELRVTPNIVTLEDKRCELADGTKVVCFKVQACLSYSGRGVPNGIELETNLTLDSSKETGQKRAFYKDTTSTVHVQKFTLFKERFSCSKHNVTFKSAIVDKLNPIDIQLEYNLMNLDRFELPPILDTYIPTKIQTQAEIWKNCGPDNICIPDLSVKAKTKASQHIVGDNKEIRLDVVVRNNGEDAYEAAVTLPLPPGVSYVSFANKNEVSNVRCGTQENEGGDSVVCSIGNPFPAGKKATFYLRLDPVKVNGTDYYLDFDFMANSSNKENSTDLKNNYWKIPLNVKVKTDILMTGLSEPEQHLFNVTSLEDPVYLTDVGPEVSHVYKVRNLGPSTIGSSTVHIHWPSLLDGTYELLYLTEMPKVTEGLGKCEVDTVINKHRLKKGKRKQRSTEAAQRSRQRRLIDGITTTTPSFREIRCKRGSESCLTIVCQLGPMAAEESATIEINSRLWLASFKKTGLTSAMIFSSADAQMMSVPYNVLPDEYSIATFQIKTYAGDRNAGVEKKMIAWWVIALAIGAGFIVLLCLIMALYKCGFFKRAKGMHTVSKEKNGSPPQNGSASKNGSKNGSASRNSSPAVKQTPSKHSSPSIKYDAIPSSEY